MALVFPRISRRIFGLFDKLDTKTEGTGIASLVKRIVEFHGGRIWARVKREKGQRSISHCLCHRRTNPFEARTDEFVALEANDRIFDG